MHNPMFFFPWLRLLSLSHSVVSWKTLCCLWMNLWDVDRWGQRWQELTVKRNFFFSTLLFLNSWKVVFRARHMSYFISFPFISFFRMCVPLEVTTKTGYPILSLCYGCACERMCLCVYVFSFFVCNIATVSSNGCLFGPLSLYLLSSSGGGEGNPLVPCVCM